MNTNWQSLPRAPTPRKNPQIGDRRDAAAQNSQLASFLFVFIRVHSWLKRMVAPGLNEWDAKS
jgi:hypothetical protein